MTHHPSQASESGHRPSHTQPYQQLLVGWIADATSQRQPNNHATCPSLMSNCLWGGSQVGQRRRWDQQRTTTPGPQHKLRNSNTTMHRWAPASRATAHGVDCRWNDDNAAATQQPPHAYEQVRATAHRPFFLSCTIFLKFPSWGVHSNQFFASFSHHFLVPFVCFSAKYRKMS